MARSFALIVCLLATLHTTHSRLRGLQEDRFYSPRPGRDREIRTPPPAEQGDGDDNSRSTKRGGRRGRKGMRGNTNPTGPTDSVSSTLEPTTVSPTPAPTTRTLEQVDQLFAGSDNFRFGHAVAMSNNTLVVGAYGDTYLGTDTGSVYVFVKEQQQPETLTVSWTQQARLIASDGAIFDHFGYAVDIYQDTIVVGAYGDDDDGSRSGSVYVFVRDGTTWTQQAKLTASDAAALDWFGVSVAIDHETLVVGAFLDDDTYTDSGSAYVFVRTGTTWNEQAKLTASDAAMFDNFGNAVAISEDTIVVGAYRADGNGGSARDSGSVYVYTRSGTTWTEQAELTASDAASLYFFGGQVAISGDTIVVASYGASASMAGGYSANAYVYTGSGASWSRQAKLVGSNSASGDEFGVSVAIDADTIALGARYDDGGGTDSGIANIFLRSGATWSEEAILTASDETSMNYFGVSVAISAESVIVGADGNSETGATAGSAYAFEWLNSASA